MTDCLDKSIYTLNINGMGTTIIIGKDLDNFKGGHKVLLEHFIKTIKEALAMSVDTENPVSDVHIYLKGCSFKDFPALIDPTKSMIFASVISGNAVFFGLTGSFNPDLLANGSSASSTSSSSGDFFDFFVALKPFNASVVCFCLIFSSLTIPSIDSRTADLRISARFIPNNSFICLCSKIYYIIAGFFNLYDLEFTGVFY